MLVHLFWENDLKSLGFPTFFVSQSHVFRAFLNHKNTQFAQDKPLLNILNKKNTTVSSKKNTTNCLNFPELQHPTPSKNPSSWLLWPWFLLTTPTNLWYVSGTKVSSLVPTSIFSTLRSARSGGTFPTFAKHVARQGMSRSLGCGSCVVICYQLWKNWHKLNEWQTPTDFPWDISLWMRYFEGKEFTASKDVFSNFSPRSFPSKIWRCMIFETKKSREATGFGHSPPTFVAFEVSLLSRPWPQVTHDFLPATPNPGDQEATVFDITPGHARVGY